MDVNFAVLNFQGGSYKLMVEKYFKDFCESLYQESYKDFFEDYQAHTDKPVAYKTCPYPVTKQDLRNYFVRDQTNLLPPHIPGNEKWKLFFRFIRNETVLGGYDFYLIFRNGKSLLWG